MMEQIREGFARASAGGVDEIRMKVAGRPVTIRCGDRDTLDLLTRPYRHLRVDRDHVPDLIVNAWSGGRSPTPPPNRGGDRRLLKSTSATVFVDSVEGLMAAYGESEAWYWTRGKALVPLWERAAPMRPIWKWWLDSIGHVLIHAAGVAVENRGVMFVGRSGSGKSTLALACFHAGMRFAGDDYIAVDPLGPTVSSIFASAKLASPDLLRGLDLAGAGEGTPGRLATKYVAFLGENAPNRLVTDFRPVAIVLPSYDPSSVNSVRATVTPAEVMRAMAVPSLLQLPGPHGDAMARMATLASRLPAFRLQSGSDLAKSVAVIEELLKS